MVIETKQEDTSKENLTKEEKSKKEVTTVSTGTNTIISKAETKSLEEIYNDIVNANNGASNSKRRSKKKNKRKKITYKYHNLMLRYSKNLNKMNKKKKIVVIIFKCLMLNK